MDRNDTRHLAMPAASAGILMASYLLLRPYGDADSSTSGAAAEAYASGWWVVAHLLGALALVQIGRLGLRIDDLLATTTTRLARWTGLAGAVLALPFYGLETFALHGIGRAGITDPSVMPLVDEVRDHPAAMTVFGLGLLLLAVSPVLTALAWHRAARPAGWAAPTWAAWPLALVAVAFVPQYALPPAGRMAYGVVFAVAAVWLAVAAQRAKGVSPRRPSSPGPRPSGQA